MIKAKAVFVGLARDSGPALGTVLANIEVMAGLFRESAIVFYENDSTDSTKTDLGAWCAARPNARLIELDGLAAEVPQRTVRLAVLRNLYTDLVRKEFADFDYLFVIDCDNSNDGRIEAQAVTRAIDFLASDPACAAVFANQEGVYFDLWALRQKDWRPGDIWEEVLDRFARGGTDQQAFQEVFAPSLRTIWPNEPPIRVQSAFGGLGIYKVPSILRNQARHAGYKPKMLLTSKGRREVGWQVCEHVSFNEGFAAQGESLYILPWLINRVTADPFTALNGWIPASAFRTYIFELAALGQVR